jgi:putative DNA primase/helicase
MTDTLAIHCGPADCQRRRLVVAALGELSHRDRFDTNSEFHRRQFREAVIERLDLRDDDHEWLDARILAAADNEDERADIRQPVLQPMADVVRREISWLWLRRFALGKLSLVIGDPGNGKSLWSLDLAARISTGCKWPDDGGHAPLGSVILMGVEDDLADTVKPRLEAAGADMSKIVALTGVANNEADGELERTVDLRRDIPVLEAALQHVENPRAIIIDPISAFMGKTDSHVNAEVRETLAPLAKLAERYGVAVIAISHLRKAETAALHRAMGSVAFTAAARSVWAIAKDKRDPEGRRRLLLPVKSNISEDQGGLAFGLTKQQGLPNSMPHIEYEPDPVTTSADDALSNEPRKRGPEPEAAAEAADYLRAALADGPRLAKDVEQEASECHGISKGTLKRARKAVGVEAFRDAVPGRWWLRLTQGAQQLGDVATYKKPALLEPLVRSSGNIDLFDPQESQEIQGEQVAHVGSNGHDPDAVNRMLADAATEDDVDG